MYFLSPSTIGIGLARYERTTPAAGASAQLGLTRAIHYAIVEGGAQATLAPEGSESSAERRCRIGDWTRRFGVYWRTGRCLVGNVKQICKRGQRKFMNGAFSHMNGAEIPDSSGLSVAYHPPRRYSAYRIRRKLTGAPTGASCFSPPRSLARGPHRPTPTLLSRRRSCRWCSRRPSRGHRVAGPRSAAAACPP